MEKFYYPTAGKLREIFADHCNLSMEQYEEISRRVMDLVQGFQDVEPMQNQEVKVMEMNIIFEFLYNTKELGLKEYHELIDMIIEIEKKAKEHIIRMAAEEGVRL